MTRHLAKLTHSARHCTAEAAPLNAQKTVTVHSLRDPGTRRPLGGPWSTEMFPNVPSRAPGTSQGPVDVSMMSVSSWRRQGRERHAPPSGVIEGWAQLSTIQPSTVAGRGKAGLLAPWGPEGGGCSQPPILGTRSATWITWPQGREPRAGPLQAGLPPWSQPPMPGGCGSSAVSVPAAGTPDPWAHHPAAHGRHPGWSFAASTCQWPRWS